MTIDPAYNNEPPMTGKSWGAFLAICGVSTALLCGAVVFFVSVFSTGQM